MTNSTEDTKIICTDCSVDAVCLNINLTSKKTAYYMKPLPKLQATRDVAMYFWLRYLIFLKIRRTEGWSENVLGRLEYAQNLPALKCSIHFRTVSSDLFFSLHKIRNKSNNFN